MGIYNMATQHQMQTYLESIEIMFENTKDKKQFIDMIGSDRFRNIIKNNMPKTYAKYGSISNTPLAVSKISKKSTINKKLTGYIQSNLSLKSKNLKVTVYEIPEELPNAFTIPGIHLGMGHEEISISNMLFGSFKVKQYNIQAKPDGNKVTLTSDSKVEPLIIMTKGLAEDNTYTDAERMSIILHEIGHWSASATAYQKPDRVLGLIHTLLGVALTIVSQTDAPIDLIIPMLIFIAVFFINGTLSRSAEFEADAFAKNAGKGKDLSDALQKMSGVEPTSTKSELDELSTILDKISAVTDFFTISSHPSVHRRSARLLESSNIEEGALSNMTSAIAEKTLSSISSRLDTMISSKPTIPLLWAFTSGGK